MLPFAAMCMKEFFLVIFLFSALFHRIFNEFHGKNVIFGAKTRKDLLTSDEGCSIYELATS